MHRIELARSRDRLNLADFAAKILNESKIMILQDNVQHNQALSCLSSLLKTHLPTPHSSWMSSMATFTGIYRGQAGSVRRLVRRERGRVRNSTLVGRGLGGGHAEVCDSSSLRPNILKFSRYLRVHEFSVPLRLGTVLSSGLSHTKA